MKRHLLTAAVVALGATAFGYAQDGPSLSIGDDAPTIDIAHWLKGADPITEFETGKVYVLEFWATWCGPCIASMPHLSEMQAKYADYDVTFIGVSDEPLSTVYEFMFKENRDGEINNNRTQYTVTCDPDESVKKDFFIAAGQRGIPCSFIIGKEGHVEWIGHPMAMDDVLEGVVHDTWDRDEFAANWNKKAESEDRSSRVRKAINDAAEAEDWKKVVAGFEELIELDEQFAAYKVQKFMVMLTEMEDVDGAYGYAREVAFDHWDDVQMLNQLAWLTVDEEGLPHRDLGFAMKAAMRASELTNNEDAAILDTVARVHFESGQLEEAVAWQRKAMDHLTGTPMDEGIREAMERYEKALKDH